MADRRLHASFASAAAIAAALSAPALSAQEADDLALDTIEVTASGTAATEGTDSYTAPDLPLASATGLPLTIRETPQSVSILTQQRLRDQAALTLKDAVDIAPGVAAAQGNGEFRWGFNARGHSIDNVQYDGVPVWVHWFSRDVNPEDDLSMYDRVEFVRGATGLIEGTGYPAASINLVRKRPFESRRTSVGAEATSFGSVGATLDHSTPLNASGSVRGRFVLNGLAGDQYRDGLSRTYGLAYGTVDADLGERTTASVGLSYAKDDIDGYAWGGLPTGRDGSFFDYTGRTQMALDWEKSDREQTVGFAEIEHRLDGGWTLRGAGRASRGDTLMRSSYLDYDATGALTRSGGDFHYDDDSYALDARASGPLRLFGREHDLVIGANANRTYNRYMTDTDYGWVIPDPMDLTDPDGPRPVPGPESWSDINVTQWGAYVNGRFELNDAAHLLAGGRLAWYENKSDGTYGFSSYSVDAEPIPYLGLTYDVTDAVTVYASYTGIFQPQSALDRSGALLDPVEGSNAEIGVKAGFLDGALEAQAALFQINETGLAEALPMAACDIPALGCSEAAGEIRTRGVDLELTGAVTEAWRVSASYTYAKAEYLEGELSGELYNTAYYPRHLGKLFTTYDFAGALDGLTLGGGMRVQSELVSEGSFWFDGTPYTIRQGGYAVFDAMARYRLASGTEIQLNVDNLLDRDYYSAISSPGYGNFMGSGITATLGLRHSF